MKKMIAFFINFLIFSALLCANTLVQAEGIPSTMPDTPLMIPNPPALNAKSYILIDANSGKVLAEKDADLRLPPASLTKLMSMYLISTALKNGSIQLTDNVHISKKAWQAEGSRMFIKVGTDVPVKELIQGVIVDSGNDATVAMAEQVGSSEDAFTEMMNKQAERLGMKNTHYMESTGLPNPNHFSTARDLATLARAILRDFPDEMAAYKQKWYTYNGIRQPNRNRLLWRYPYATGLKTGHTEEAGYCLVGSAEKDGMVLISVVMGSPSDNARSDDSVRLLSYGYRFFETHKLYDANAKVSDARVYQGKSKTIPAGALYDLYVTVPQGHYSQMQLEVETDAMKAPLKKGDVVGHLIVKINQQKIDAIPLVALRDNPTGGLWRRMIDKFAMHRKNKKEMS